MNDTDTGSHELPTVVRMPAEEQVPAARLPPISVPPMHGNGSRPASAPAMGSYPPPSIPRGAGVKTFLRWKAHVASFFAGRAEDSMPATPLALDKHAVQRIGIMSVCVGVVLALAGVAIALRGAAASALGPVVTASLVIARAFSGLGLVALGLGLMRLGERLLLSKPRSLFQSEPSAPAVAPPQP